MPTGTVLRQARQRAGLTAEQIAERTAIELHEVVALENDNFELLPDGFDLEELVRAYSREVAIDPEPLIERVHHEQALDSQSLAGLFISESPQGPVRSESPQGPVKSEVPQGPVNNDGSEKFVGELSAAALPKEWNGVSASPRDDIDVIEAGHISRPPDLPLISHPAARPVQREQVRPVRTSRGRRRVALPLVTLLAAAGWAAYLHETTRLFDRSSAPDSAASRQQSAGTEEIVTDAPPGTANQDRPRDQIVPSDGGTSSTHGGRGAPSDANRAGVPAGTTGLSGSSSAEKRPLPDGAQPAARRERPATAPARPAPRSPTDGPAVPSETSTAAASGAAEITAPGANVRDVSGSWALTTHVESTSYAPFTGLNLGYEIQLTQTGERVTGAGRKVLEESNGTSSRACTPIQVDGTIDGDRVTLTFTERGARRPTQGKFVLLLDMDGALRGRFSSDAARSSGTVEAHRLAP